MKSMPNQLQKTAMLNSALKHGSIVGRPIQPQE